MRCDLTVKYENVPRRDVVFDATPISYYSCRHCVEKNIVPEAMQSTAIVYGKIYTVIWVCKPISSDGQVESSDGVRTIDIEKEEIKQLTPEEIEAAEKLQKELSEMSGTKRAAVLMLLLGEQQAAEIIRFLNPKEVQALGGAMVSVAVSEAIMPVTERPSAVINR